MDVCLRVLKESNKSRLDSCSVRNSVLIIPYYYIEYPILPFGVVACTIFLTTFFEIAVDDTILAFYLNTLCYANDVQCRDHHHHHHHHHNLDYYYYFIFFFFANGQAERRRSACEAASLMPRKILKQAEKFSIVL